VDRKSHTSSIASTSHRRRRSHDRGRVRRNTSAPVALRISAVFGRAAAEAVRGAAVAEAGADARIAVAAGAVCRDAAVGKRIISGERDGVCGVSQLDVLCL